MSNISCEILSELEWDDGVSMPAANAENKALENQIKDEKSSVNSTQNDLAETEDRIKAYIDHLKNMRQELQNTQGLVIARHKELETELHLQKLTQREKGHLKKDVTELMKEIDELNIKNNAFQSNILIQTLKMKQLQSEMNLDQQALEAWLEESARKDDDAMTVQKYTRQDEVKIKELSHCEEKLIADILQKKHRLKIEVINTLTSQIELDKTAENFRNAHLDREQLLLQWENTIELMQKRDRQMDTLAEKLTEAKNKVRKCNKIMNDKLKFLKNARENNVETEKNISVAERTNIFVKKELSEAEEGKRQFEHETEMLQRTLEQSVLDLELARAGVNKLKMEIIEKNNKLKQVNDLRQSLDEKLTSTIESTLTVGEKATMIDNMLMAEEKKQENLRLQLKSLESILCKSQQEFNATKTEHRTMEATVNCANNTIKNLFSKIQRLDNDTLKQQEILYNQNLHYQQLTNRCLRMEGEQSSEDKALMEEKATELQTELDYQNQAHTLLVNQIRQLQDSRYHVISDLGKFQAENANIFIKIAEINLYNIGLESEFKSLVNKKQNLMVDENLLKLEMKKIRDLLNFHADDILSLEIRKLQLDTGLKERHQEIAIHQEMLAAKIKVAEEKKHQISAELFKRMSRIDRLKMKFEFIIISMAPPNGDGETSQVYFLIKAAAEKDALQREGDNLDLRIRKAEKEVRALENTINMMNGRNDLFKQSFEKITESSDEMNKKHELDEQLRAAIDKYKYKKKQIEELHEQMNTLGTTFDHVAKNENSLQISVKDRKDKVSKMRSEIKGQREKLNRASKQIARLLRELRSSRKVLEEVPEEKDMKIRELKNFNNGIMKMILEAAQMPEMSQAVQLYFNEANLPLPDVDRKSSSLFNIQENISSMVMLSLSSVGISEPSAEHIATSAEYIATSAEYIATSAEPTESHGD